MKPTTRRIYFHVGGTILAWTSYGPEPIELAEAARLHAHHVGQVVMCAATGRASGEAYHKARETELREAIADKSLWRRAACVQQPRENAA